MRRPRAPRANLALGRSIGTGCIVIDSSASLECHDEATRVPIGRISEWPCTLGAWYIEARSGGLSPKCSASSSDPPRAHLEGWRVRVDGRARTGVAR